MGPLTQLIVDPILWMLFFTLPLCSRPRAPSPKAQLKFVQILLITLINRHGAYLATRKEAGWREVWIPRICLGLIVYLVIVWERRVKENSTDQPRSGSDSGDIGDCVWYVCRLCLFAVAKPAIHVVILGLKNRKSWQLLLGFVAVVTGLTISARYAAIPTVVVLLFSIPDLDYDISFQFTVRFATFLPALMDDQSVRALLNSKHFKMLSRNEMKPSVPGHIQARARAWFVRDEGNSASETFSCSSLRREYRIGLGLITIYVREGHIDVGVRTPFSGAKSITIDDTPRSRYNLDNSASFWSRNPDTGIWSKEERMAMSPDEAKFHCLSVDEWVKLCGSDDHIFEELAEELAEE